MKEKPQSDQQPINMCEQRCCRKVVTWESQGAGKQRKKEKKKESQSNAFSLAFDHNSANLTLL
jgi:hypothetical protein